MNPGQRWSKAHPCRVCGGFDGATRGAGERCHGFLSSDGKYAHCTRPEHAGRILLNPKSQAYPHRVGGPCDCGKVHEPAPVVNGADHGVQRVLRDADFARCVHPYPCDYKDVDGRVLFRVARWQGPDGRKRIVPYRPDGSGGWVAGRGDKRPLYGLHVVQHAVEHGEPVHITEGEKKAHLLRDLGLHATCADGGSGQQFTPEHAESLRGAKRVVVWADNDPPGRRYAQQVAQRVREAGVEDVRLVLPDVPEGQGVDDWLAARASKSPDERRAELLALVEAAPVWQPETSQTERPKPDRRRSKGEPEGGRAIQFNDPEPWPEPVDGAALLNKVAGAIRRFVWVAEDAVVAAALWVAMTYLMDHVEASPRLLLKSPTRECGKSRFLSVLAALVRWPVPASSTTPAALFRVVERYGPTLLLDEADNLALKDNPDLRAVLNSGHTRGTAFVLRTIGETHEPAQFSTWAAIALASIGRVPDTVSSRSIVVNMERKPPNERLDRHRESRLVTELEPLRQRLARWAADHGPALGDPDLPGFLDGRDADNWTPLLSIADAAGGDWPERARKVAAAFVGAHDEQDEGSMLLADLRDLFAERDVDRLSSEDMVQWLNAREDRPWPDSGGGKGLTKTRLARLLGRFGIIPGTIRLQDGRTPKGYYRDQFEGAWRQYLRGGCGVPVPERVTLSNGASAANDGPCDGVADSGGGVEGGCEGETFGGVDLDLFDPEQETEVGRA